MGITIFLCTSFELKIRCRVGIFEEKSWKKAVDGDGIEFDVGSRLVIELLMIGQLR